MTCTLTPSETLTPSTMLVPCVDSGIVVPISRITISNQKTDYLKISSAKSNRIVMENH